MTRRFRSIWLIALALAVLSGFAAAEGAGAGAAGFFANRSVEELAALDRGELIVGKLSDWKKMGLGVSGVEADSLRSRIAGLRPNYITEFLAEIPAKGGELERLAAALGKVQDFKAMVYHSKRYDKDFPLFDKMIVESRASGPGGEVIVSSQHMQPFEDFEARYEYRLSGDLLSFESGNTSELRYFGISAVRPGEMTWSILARRSEAGSTSTASGRCRPSTPSGRRGTGSSPPSWAGWKLSWATCGARRRADPKIEPIGNRVGGENEGIDSHRTR